MQAPDETPILLSRHLLGIEGVSVAEITALLDLAEGYVRLNRAAAKKQSLLRGRTLINLFFESRPGPRVPSSSPESASAPT